MKRFRWSKLYPRSWREQFGDEFDELNEKRRVRFTDGLDILFRAACIRLANAARLWPFLVAWILIGYLNLYAYEVQWAAGGLLLSSFFASLACPRKWLHYACFFFVVIPISTLLLYQDTSTKHAPLYQSAVALLPSLAGALFGRLTGLTSRTLLRGRP